MTHYNPNPYGSPQQYNQQPPNKKGVPGWVKGVGGVFAGLLVIGACGSILGDSEEPTVNSSPPVVEAEINAPAPVPQNADPAPAPVPVQNDPGVGATVRDGKFEFTVNSWDGVSVVNITVTNIGNEPKYVFSENIVLVDDQGRKFTPESDWTSDLWLNELQPGQSVQGSVSYSLYGAVPSHLMLHDSMFSRGAKVVLN